MTLKVILNPLNRFTGKQSAAGVVLFFCTLLALIWANSPLVHYYHELWHYTFLIGFGDYVISNTLHHWINDGLMAMFFFVVGLELKREIMAGELSSPKQALLPLMAAVGGMVVPALIFVAFNPHRPENAGWGIPMATDIAFALSILALVGSRAPLSLKVFLTALAIADDIGAVLVIAFFYTSDISFMNLATGILFMAVLIVANYMGVRNSIFYGIVGIGGLWLAFLMSGVHATIAGVLAAFTIPARTKINEVAFTARLKELVKEFTAIPPNNVTLLEPRQVEVIGKIKNLTLEADTPLQRLEHGMHSLVAFVVMPLFALANAGITIHGAFIDDLIHPVSLGVLLGLLAGKLIGVAGVSFLMVKLKLASLPRGMTWRHMIGAGFLAGVGFTMSLFITNLAFSDDATLNTLAKSGILLASLVAGLIGFFILRSDKKSFRAGESQLNES